MPAMGIKRGLTNAVKKVSWSAGSSHGSVPCCAVHSRAHAVLLVRSLSMRRQVSLYNTPYSFNMYATMSFNLAFKQAAAFLPRRDRNALAVRAPAFAAPVRCVVMGAASPHV